MNTEAFPTFNPVTIRDMVNEIYRSNIELTRWEENFLTSMEQLYINGKYTTFKQGKYLKIIHDRYRVEAAKAQPQSV